MMTAGMNQTTSRRFNFDRLVITLVLTGMSESITRGGLMQSMLRLAISLVSEAGMLPLTLHSFIFINIKFSGGFDRLNHQGILFKLCLLGVGGSVLSVLTKVSLQSITICHGGQQAEQTKMWWCHKCLRNVLRAHICYTCTHNSFSPYWRTSITVTLMTPI